MTLFFGFVVATFLTMVLIPPLARAARSLHATDQPGERKVHETTMPRLGGIAMAVGAIVPLILWAPLDRQAVAILAGIGIIVCFGVWDDMRHLDYRIKFAGQIAAVLVVILAGDVVIRFVPFAGVAPLPDWVAVPLTAFALVGVTNALNLADGLDGLAGGITLLSLAAISALAYLSGERGFVLFAALSIIGGILGFLRFNTYPARIFMGDGGSQFLGFAAGILVVLLTQQVSTALSPALPLLILGLPIVDTMLVMAERLHEGRSPFVADRKHVHHRLLALGFHHYEAVLAIYAAQSAFIVLAYALRFESDALILGIYGGCLAVGVAFLKAAPRLGWHLHLCAAQHSMPAIPRWIAWLRRDQRILRTAFQGAVVAIPAFFLAGAFLVPDVPRDIGALAGVLLVGLLALYVRCRHGPFNVVEKAIVYVAAMCVVYLVQRSPAPVTGLRVCYGVLFATMAVAVVVGFRVGRERFRITPMDFLVIFIAVAVPNLPDLQLDVQHLGVAVGMIIVLLYSIELVLNGLWRRWDLMRLTTYATLAVLGLRGLSGS